MPQTDKINNFMSRCTWEAEQLLTSYNKLVDLRDEWSKLGLSAQAIDDVLAETPASDNKHLTGAIVVGFMTSVDNLVTYMNAGNGTNLYKLKR